MSQMIHPSSRPNLNPRRILARVLEFSLLCGIVAAMAVGVMRLQ
jgi:hypothetical protein